MIWTVHGSDQNASNILNDYRRDRQAGRQAEGLNHVCD